MKRLSFLVLALALSAGAFACGDDDDSGKGGAGSNAESDGGGKNGGSKNDDGGNTDETTDAGHGNASGDAGSATSTSMKITAAKGGTIALGKAALNIPAGSLGSDATITLDTSSPSSDLPDSDKVKGLVYDFGPDGTKFSKPAKLTLPSAGKPGADEEAVIAWLDEKNNAWQNLTTTTNDDGSLSAEVTHFTNFAVIFNGVESSDCGFKACGGDVVGTWKVTSVCAEIDKPVIDMCPTAVATLELNLDGTATFNKDGTSSTDFTSSSKITYTLDAACLNAITMSHPPASCDALSKDADPSMGDGPTTCSGDPKTACTCVQDNPESSEKKTAKYTIEGNTMTSTDDGDGTKSTSDFCVNGSEVRFKGTEGLAVLTWIAQKQ